MEHTTAIETSILGLLEDICTHDGLCTLELVILKTYFFMNHRKIWKAYDRAFRKLHEGLDPRLTPSGEDVLKKLQHESGIREPAGETMQKEVACCIKSGTTEFGVNENEMPILGF